MRHRENPTQLEIFNYSESFLKKEETWMCLFTFNPKLNFLFQKMLNVFFKMGLIEKILWEVGEKYILLPMLHTFFNPEVLLLERI